jgi:mannosyltransferase OCH1-like enzyme
MIPKETLGIILPIFFILFLSFYNKSTLDFSQTVLGKVVFVCIILFYAEIKLTYGFVALVFVVFFYKICFPIDYFGKKRGIITEATQGSNTFTRVPLIIYQTWHSKKLPPKMSACVERLKYDNPEFEHHLYDDADCRGFIKDNYEKEILDAYDQLVPGAYKADLWRYCMLYKMGGIYLDIKFQCEPGFSLMEFTKEEETFVLDRPYGDLNIPLEVNLSIINSPEFYENLPKYTDGTWNNRQIGLYNAVIATVPHNPILYDCIQRIVKNVKTQNYGYNALYPTGPGLLGEVYFTTDCENDYLTKVKQVKYFNSIQGTYILNNDKKVLSQYPEYRAEQRKYSEKGPLFYYSDLWYNKKIYGL